MKKITTLFFLFIILFITSNQTNEKTMLVNYIEDDSYKKIYLKFEGDELTTKNFKIYFSNIKIISLYTSDNCFNNHRYLFRFSETDNNLDGYIEFYNNLYMANTINYFNGTPIGIVEVVLDENNLEKIMSKNPNVKYSNEICGNYHR